MSKKIKDLYEKSGVKIDIEQFKKLSENDFKECIFRNIQEIGEVLELLTEYTKQNNDRVNLMDLKLDVWKVLYTSDQNANS